jgi:hypothetical protein
LIQTLSLLATFLGASVWLMRFATSQQKAITDRFIHHLEQLIEKQQEEQRLNRAAIRQLTGAVRRNSQLAKKLLERKTSHVPEHHESYGEVKMSDNG